MIAEQQAVSLTNCSHTDDISSAAQTHHLDFAKGSVILGITINFLLKK